jgi:hypothetical protein
VTSTSVGSAGTIGPAAIRDSGRAGPRSGRGRMTVVTDAYACRGSPARISRASSAGAGSRPRVSMSMRPVAD